MNSVLSRIMFMIFCLVPAQGTAQALKDIKVLNAKFETITIITSPDQVTKFETFWMARTEVTTQVKPTWKYKVDLRGIKPSGRWLYDPAGYIQKLSHNKPQLFFVAPTDQFNQLLGIKE